MLWTILGFSVGILAVFCITVAETLVPLPMFDQFRPYAAIALGVAGGVFWFIGRALGRKLAANGGNPRFILVDLRYWGPMLMVFGLITLFIRPLRQTHTDAPQMVARPAPKPAVVVAKVPEPPKPQPVIQAPPVFPRMKMQGVFFRSAHPFAIINGQSYTVGDHVGEVLVRSIDKESVLVEFGGEIKTLTMN